uniref:Uncharacterized protein n=1 Tax=Arundo donax TaxID=35708 RepID=A0A0A9GYB5_ARUDO
MIMFFPLTVVLPPSIKSTDTSEGEKNFPNPFT